MAFGLSGYMKRDFHYLCTIVQLGDGQEDYFIYLVLVCRSVLIKKSNIETENEPDGTGASCLQKRAARHGASARGWPAGCLCYVRDKLPRGNRHTCRLRGHISKVMVESRWSTSHASLSASVTAGVLPRPKRVKLFIFLTFDPLRHYF